jgi:hypothetical protein
MKFDGHLSFEYKNIKINNEEFDIYLECNIKDLFHECDNNWIKFSLANVSDYSYKIDLCLNYDLNEIRNLLKIVEHKMENIKSMKDKKLNITKRFKYKNEPYKISFYRGYPKILDLSTPSPKFHYFPSPIIKLSHSENITNAIDTCKRIIEDKEFLNNFVYKTLEKFLSLLPTIQDSFLNNSKITENITDIPIFSIQFFVMDSPKWIQGNNYISIFEYLFEKYEDNFYIKRFLSLTEIEKIVINFEMDLDYNFEMFEKIVTIFKNLALGDFHNIDLYYKNKKYNINYDFDEIKIYDESNNAIFIWKNNTIIDNNNIEMEINKLKKILSDHEKIMESYRFTTNNLFGSLSYFVNKLLNRFGLCL